MAVSASTLRQNIYKLLDQILETGHPLEIERKGKKLKITPVEKKNKLDNLKGYDIMNAKPDYFVHIDWSSEWKI
jgi:antitoxin (DNA-binding transcriptional repressor) of toxin-antitoxin stability system